DRTGWVVVHLARSIPPWSRAASPSSRINFAPSDTPRYARGVIDAKLLRENPDVVRAALTKRGESADLVDQILVADSERRSSISPFEALRAEQKTLGKQVAQAKGDERTALLERTKSLAADVKANEAAANEAGARFDELSRALPNLVSDEAPVGGED